MRKMRLTECEIDDIVLILERLVEGGTDYLQDEFLLVGEQPEDMMDNINSALIKLRQDDLMIGLAFGLLAGLAIHKHKTCCGFSMPANFYLDAMGVTAKPLRMAGRSFYHMARYLARNKIDAVLVHATS